MKTDDPRGPLPRYTPEIIKEIDSGDVNNKRVSASLDHATRLHQNPNDGICGAHFQ